MKSDLTSYNRLVFFCTDRLHLSNKDSDKIDPSLELP